MSEKWDQRFMALAQHIAQWSKDPSTKVGTVIVDYDRRVIGLGYNGFPRYVKDEPSRYELKELKYKLVVHAEANAILNAQLPLKSTTLYSSKSPCAECAKLIVQSGIGRVICPEPSAEGIWAEDAEFARIIFKEASIMVTRV